MLCYCFTYFLLLFMYPSCFLFLFYFDFGCYLIKEVLKFMPLIVIILIIS